jgi:hypothetical protein
MNYLFEIAQKFSNQIRQMQRISILILCCIGGVFFFGPEEKKAYASDPDERFSSSFTPTFEYWVVDLSGWKLYVHPSILNRPQQWRDFVSLMNKRLDKVRELLPQNIFVQVMQSTIFWVETSNEALPQAGLVYHISEDWLRAYGQNPDKAGHIEITNLEKSLEFLEKDSNVGIHEIIYAYHQKFIPKALADAISSGYAQALVERRYESVPYADGVYRKAIAIANKWAYFAELTEAYLGKNNCYPFVRGDIAIYDPFIYPILTQIYGN